MEASSILDYTSPNHHKYNGRNRFYMRHLERFMRTYAEMLAATAPSTVLDAGCGEGYATQFMARQLPEVSFTGIDLSAEAVAFARHAFGEMATYEQGSLYELPFSDNAFDAVVCSEVLEHLYEPDKAVAELARVARHYVLLTVPREPIFKWLNDLGRTLGFSPDPGHVNFWTPAGFEAFVRTHFDTGTFCTHGIYQIARVPVDAYRGGR